MTIATIRHRRWVLPATALVAMLALAGCAAGAPSGAPADDPASSGAPDALPPAEGATTYPLTVTTEVGKAVIPERPRRIVMANSWDGDLFAALGVAPVATDEQIEFFPWTLEAFPVGIETLWPIGDVTYPAETIAATAPDLIVDTEAVDAAEITQLGAIGPVVGAPKAESTWQERILLLGGVLDLSNRAQQVIDDYDAAFEQIRAEYPQFAGKSIDYVVFYGTEWGADLVNIADSDAEALFTNLGFAPNPNAANPAVAGEISDEMWGSLSGDVLVISNQEAAGFDAFFANPLIQGLASVKSGRVVVLDVDTTAWTVTHEGERTGFTGHFGRAFNYGPLAHRELADLLAPLIADALD